MSETNTDGRMTVKFAEGSDTIIEGYGVPFGMDLDGQRFEADTERCHDWFPNGGRPILHDHGFNKKIKMTPVGRELSTVTDEIGDFVQAELDKSHKYYEALAQLVRGGKLGWSSGAPDHKVKVARDGKIELWPVVEYSLTTAPAFPNKVAYAMKSAQVIQHLQAVDADIPDSLNEAIDESLDASLAGLPYADHADRVLADTTALVTRTQEIAALRAKAKRRINVVTRDRLAAVRDQAQQVIDDIEALLVESDPDAARKAATAAFVAYQREVARMNGVPL